MADAELRQRKAAPVPEDVVVDEGESDDEVEYEGEPDEHEMSALDYLQSQGLSLKSLKDPSNAKTGASCCGGSNGGGGGGGGGGAAGGSVNVKAAIKARRKKAQAEDGEKATKKEGGIKWLPLIFLIFMMGPALFTAVDYLFSLPMFARFHRKPDVKECLVNYYRKVSPERLNEVNVDDVLRKYKGREGTMIRNLEGRYRRKWQCP